LVKGYNIEFSFPVGVFIYFPEKPILLVLIIEDVILLILDMEGRKANN